MSFFRPAPVRQVFPPANTQTAPKFALIEVEGGFIVEAFDPDKHLSPIYGWSGAGVTLFSSREEVEHLRDQILN